MYIEQHCKINEENKVHSPIDIVDDRTTRCFFGLRGGHVSGDSDVFRTCLTRVLGLSLKGLKNACKLNNICFNDLPRENLIVFCDDFSAHFDERGYRRASKSRRGTRLENHYWFGTDFDRWAPLDLDSLFSHLDNIFVTNLKSPIVSSSIGNGVTGSNIVSPIQSKCIKQQISNDSTNSVSYKIIATKFS